MHQYLPILQIADFVTTHYYRSEKRSRNLVTVPIAITRRNSNRLLCLEIRVCKIYLNVIRHRRCRRRRRQSYARVLFINIYSYFAIFPSYDIENTRSSIFVPIIRVVSLSMAHEHHEG